MMMKQFLAYGILALGLLSMAQIALATTARMTLSTDGPIDFGDVLIGTFVDRTVSIRNDGSADLTGTVTLSPPFALVGGGKGVYDQAWSHLHPCRALHS